MSFTLLGLRHCSLITDQHQWRRCTSTTLTISNNMVITVTPDKIPVPMNHDKVLYLTAATPAPSSTRTTQFPTVLRTNSPTSPVQPMDSARNEATIVLPPGMLMILAVCLAICSMGCCIKKSQRTVSTPTIASSSTQQNANRRQNSARRYMSRDAELEIIQKMSVSDRKLFLTNALKTDVYKTSST
jgi:hypothetical protein